MAGSWKVSLVECVSLHSSRRHNRRRHHHPALNNSRGAPPKGHDIYHSLCNGSGRSWCGTKVVDVKVVLEVVLKIQAAAWQWTCLPSTWRWESLPGQPSPSPRRGWRSSETLPSFCSQISEASLAGGWFKVDQLLVPSSTTANGDVWLISGKIQNGNKDFIDFVVFSRIPTMARRLFF